MRQGVTRSLRRVLFASALVLSALYALLLPSFALKDPPDASNADAVYFYNVEQDKVMYEKNAKKIIYPASTVKLMTGLVAIENLSSRLDEKITITAEMLDGVRGNNISLEEGETVSVTDMLYATICGGSNDSASVLAYVVSGGTDGFVALMNEKAAALGATDTHYENVSGMHDNNMKTTAYDTFLIAKAAAENDLFSEISSENKYIMAETDKSKARNIYNRNMLISCYSETKYFNTYVRGLNAGSTTQGGYCLATCAQKEGQTYLCVVMGAEEIDNVIYSYQTANDLINWAYSSFGYIEVLTTDRLVCEVPVTISDSVDYVTLSPEKPLEVFLPLDVVPEKDLTYSYKITSDSLEAPVAEGQVAGFITVSYGDTVIGTVNLCAINKVDRSEFLYTLKRLKDFTRTRVFIASAVSLVVLLAVYIFGTAVYRSKNRRRRYYR